MVDVVTHIEIRRPVADVAAYAADPDKAPEWYENIDSAEWRTEPPLQVGSLIAFKAQFLGRELLYVYEIVEFEPRRLLVMRTESGPFLMETTYTWVATDDGITRMTLRNRGTPSGFSGLVAPFMAMAMRLANRKDLRRMKAILEG